MNKLTVTDNIKRITSRKKMKTIESMLRMELDKLKKVVTDAQKRLHRAPKGIVYLKAKKNCKEYIRRWQAVEYKGKSLEEHVSEIVTERGERVRSKSEKIIADKLNALGVPYRYEFPLLLDVNIKVYPDFTILKMPEREEVYLEHFGMMDNADYIDGVLHKLDIYERNGIYIGANLFVTYETSKKTLNTRTLTTLLKTLFCSE